MKIFVHIVTDGIYFTIGFLLNTRMEIFATALENGHQFAFIPDAVTTQSPWFEVTAPIPFQKETWSFDSAENPYGPAYLDLDHACGIMEPGVYMITSRATLRLSRVWVQKGTRCVSMVPLLECRDPNGHEYLFIDQYRMGIEVEYNEDAGQWRLWNPDEVTALP